MKTPPVQTGQEVLVTPDVIEPVLMPAVAFRAVWRKTRPAAQWA